MAKDNKPAETPTAAGEKKDKKPRRSPAEYSRHEIMAKMDALLKGQPPANVVRMLTMLLEEYKEKMGPPTPTAQPGGQP